MRGRVQRGLRALAVLVAIGALALASGCAWASASPYDHAAYRETIVAPTFEARLVAADAYLTKYPDGAYAEEVRAYMKRAEPIFYASREKSVQGLESYQATLPNGPRAEEVRSRLRAIYEQKARPDSFLVAARGTEDRLRRAQAGRELARQEVAFWIGLLADPELYRAPVSQGPIEFVRAFSLALPEPRCALSPVTNVRVCTKDLSVTYEVPTAAGPEERLLAFSVVLTQDPEGKPLRAVIEGEELFLRVEETYAKRGLDAEVEADARAASDRALELMDGALASLGPAGDVCPRAPGADAGVLASFPCEGLGVTVSQVKPFDRVEFVPRERMKARLQ